MELFWWFLLGIAVVFQLGSIDRKLDQINDNVKRRDPLDKGLL